MHREMDRNGVAESAMEGWFFQEAFDLSENPMFASNFRADCTTEQLEHVSSSERLRELAPLPIGKVGIGPSHIYSNMCC